MTNTLTQARNIHIFNESACTRCGECLNQCPELSLPLADAKREIANLIEGKQSEYVLAHCTTCFSCNLFCPNDCHPYQLILERWNDLYARRGAPAIYRFVCPTMEGNIWQLLEVLLRPEEKAWIREWMDQEPTGDILLIGNYVHLLPFVIGNSRLLDFFTPVDLIDHWECGAYLYQGGYLDEVSRIAQKCADDFKKWDVKRVVPLIDAVHWMMTNVHPNEMNVRHDVEVVNFYHWFLEKLDRKEITLPHQLGVKVTVHDNCYSKAGKGQYWDPPREILRRSGCEIVEMDHIRENSLCCGFGAGASWVRPFDILFNVMSIAEKKIREAEKTGADALVSYCGGCLYLLWAARELFDSKLDIYHLVEIQRMAMGEEIEYPGPHVARAWDMTYTMIRTMFRPCFKITEISMDQCAMENRSFPALKFLRRLLDLPGAKAVYKISFKMMVKLFKTRRWKKIELQ